MRVLCCADLSAQVIDVEGVHLATNLQSAQQLLAQYERS
jgi:hypothetical protein